MGETTTTNVIYEESTEITLADGSKQMVYASEDGGALTVEANQAVPENTILISPHLQSGFRVEATDINGKPLYPVEVQTNKTDAAFHELGHVIYRGGYNQEKVIDFNNEVRSLIRMYPRPYDASHNSTVK